MKVILLKGLPASGKTTLAKKMQKDNPGKYIRVNKDELRDMLHNNEYSKNNEEFTLGVRDLIIEKALYLKRSVIVDDTNFNPIHEEMIQKIADFHKVPVEVIELKATVEECIERDSKREKSVGEKVIREMASKYLAKDHKEIPHDEERGDCIIVDMDGTLAIKGDRSPYDWKNVGKDTLNLPVKKVIDMVAKEGVKVFIVSGRDGECYEETNKWLVDNGVKFDALFMRSERNTEKDSLIKERIYKREIEGNYNVLFVLDDRDQVVKMWRDNWLPCFQVNYGNF